MMMNMVEGQDKTSAATMANMVDNYSAITRSGQAADAARMNAILDYDAALKNVDVARANSGINQQNADTNRWKASLDAQELGLKRQIEASQALLRDAQATNNLAEAGKRQEEIKALQAKQRVIQSFQTAEGRGLQRPGASDLTLADKLTLGIDPMDNFSAFPNSNAIYNQKDGTYLEIPPELIKDANGNPLNDKRNIEIMQKWAAFADRATHSKDKDGNVIPGGGVTPATDFNEQAPGLYPFGFIVRGSETERYELPLDENGRQMTLGDVRKAIRFQKPDGSFETPSVNDQLKIFKYSNEFFSRNKRLPTTQEILTGLRNGEY